MSGLFANSSGDSKKQPRWAVPAGTYLIAVFIFGLMAGDLIWPRQSALALLELTHPDNLRLCVGIIDEDDNHSRTFILLPDSFQEHCLFTVHEPKNRLAHLGESQAGTFVFTTAICLLLLYSFITRILTDLRTVAAVKLTPNPATLGAVGKAIWREWNSSTYETHRTLDFKLFMIFFATLVGLAALGGVLHIAITAFLIATALVLLVRQSVARKRRESWIWQGLSAGGAIFAGINIFLAIVLIASLPPQFRALSSTSLPFLTAIAGLFLFSALECLGLTS